MFSEKQWLVGACCWLWLVVDRSGAETTQAVDQVVQLTNQLLPRLLQFVHEKEEDVVVSPFGLVTSLAMIVEGLDETTRLEVWRALALQPGDRHAWQSLRPGFAFLFTAFQDEKNKGDVSGTYNHAVVRSSLPLVPHYKDLLLTYYRTNVTQINQPPNVTEHTMEVTSDSGVISHWRDYKSLAVTYLEHQNQGTFTLPDNSSLTVPMVTILSPSAGPISSLNALAARLPLEDLSSDLYLVMPESDSMEDILKRLEKKKLMSLLLALPQKDHNVAVPQLSIISTNLDMMPFVQGLGVSRMFSAGGKSQKVRVSKIIQNSYFGTSFIGLKSVASSSATMNKKMVVRSRQRREVSSKLEFNKPFLFCVIHKASGLILLSGIVTHPKQNP